MSGCLRYTNFEVPYTYKFSRDVNFTNDSNLGLLHTLCFKCITIVL